jgi:hypothetical protein
VTHPSIENGKISILPNVVLFCVFLEHQSMYNAQKHSNLERCTPSSESFRTKLCSNYETCIGILSSGIYVPDFTASHLLVTAVKTPNLKIITTAPFDETQTAQLNEESNTAFAAPVSNILPCRDTGSNSEQQVYKTGRAIICHGTVDANYSYSYRELVKREWNLD